MISADELMKDDLPGSIIADSNFYARAALSLLTRIEIDPQAQAHLRASNPEEAGAPDPLDDEDAAILTVRSEAERLAVLSHVAAEALGRSNTALTQHFGENHSDLLDFRVQPTLALPDMDADELSWRHKAVKTIFDILQNMDELGGATTIEYVAVMNALARELICMLPHNQDVLQVETEAGEIAKHIDKLASPLERIALLNYTAARALEKACDITGQLDAYKTIGIEPIVGGLTYPADADVLPDLLGSSALDAPGMNALALKLATRAHEVFIEQVLPELSDDQLSTLSI